MQGEVQKRIHLALEASNVRDVAREDLSHTEDTSAFAKDGPEAGFDQFCGVESEPVDFVVGDQVFNPSLVSLDDCGVCGVDVGKGDMLVTNPARVHRGRVPFVEWAVRMVQGRILEHVRREIGCSRSSHNIVDDDVNHDIPMLRSSEYATYSY